MFGSACHSASQCRPNICVSNKELIYDVVSNINWAMAGIIKHCTRSSIYLACAKCNVWAGISVHVIQPFRTCHHYYRMLLYFHNKYSTFISPSSLWCTKQRLYSEFSRVQALCFYFCFTLFPTYFLFLAISHSLSIHLSIFVLVHPTLAIFSGFTQNTKNYFTYEYRHTYANGFIYFSFVLFCVVLCLLTHFPHLYKYIKCGKHWTSGNLAAFAYTYTQAVRINTREREGSKRATNK